MDDLAGPGAPDSGEAVTTGEDAQLLSLKDGNTFLVADAWGDVSGAPTASSATTRAFSRVSGC